MNLPPLIQLRAFEAAARHLSFKKAADELRVTPTAISHQIRLLERFCGRALFRRRPRPISLTRSGDRLFPVVREGLNGFAEALDAIRREGDKQPLRVTTTNAFASRWLVPRLPGWRQTRAAVPLEIIGTDSVLDLSAGDADVAIRYARTPPANQRSEEILHDSFWPMCSRELLSTGAPLTKVPDIRKHVLVHCYWPPSDREAPTWQRWLAAARNRWRQVPDIGDMGHLSFREELHAIEAVIAGQGIGIFSDVLVAPELMSGKLVKLFDLSLPGYSFYVVRTSHHPREKTIAAFSQWLRSSD